MKSILIIFFILVIFKAGNLKLFKIVRAQSLTVTPTDLIELTPTEAEISVSPSPTPNQTENLSLSPTEIIPSMGLSPTVGVLSPSPSLQVKAEISASPTPTNKSEPSPTEALASPRPTATITATATPTPIPVPIMPPRTGDGPPVAEQVEKIGRVITKPLDYINPVINRKIYGEERLSQTESNNLISMGIMSIILGITIIRPKQIDQLEKLIGRRMIWLQDSQLLRAISRIL